MHRAHGCTAGVAKGLGLHLQRLCAALPNFSAVAQARHRHVQALGVDVAAVVQLAGANVGLQPGAHAAAVGDALPFGVGAGVQAQVARGRDAAADVLPLRGLDGHMAQLGLDGAGRAEPALGVDVHIARAGTQGAVVAHAHAGFGANEGDLAGVHAAELAHVQRKGRGVAGRRGGAGLHLVLVGVDGVVARHHLQVVGVDLGVELDGARQDAGVIGEAGIDPRAVDADGAALHAVGL